MVIAVARRKGSTHYVTLIDGTLAAWERRSAQLNTAIAGLKVPGRAEEDLAAKNPHTLDPARIEKFLAFAERAQQLTKVPGVALAVVQDGRIVVEKGLGVLELGKPEPVTPRDAVHDRLDDQAADVAALLNAQDRLGPFASKTGSTLPARTKRAPGAPSAARKNSPPATSTPTPKERASETPACRRERGAPLRHPRGSLAPPDCFYV